MALDPNVLLSAANIGVGGSNQPDTNALLNVLKFGREQQQFNEAQQNKNALRSLAKDPSNLDKNTGLYTPKGINSLYQIDPILASETAQTQSKVRHETAISQMENQKVLKEQRLDQAKLISDANLPNLEQYNEELKTIGKDAAVNNYKKRANEIQTNLKDSGQIPDEVTFKFGQNPDADYVQNANFKAMQDTRKEAAKEKKDEATISHQAASEEHQLATEKETQRHNIQTEKAAERRADERETRAIQKDKRGTEGERKATMNYISMKQANDIISKLDPNDEKTASMLPEYANVIRDSHGLLRFAGPLGGYIKGEILSPDQQKLYQAITQFAEGAGHLKSGARINKDTLDIMQNIYLPMPGDSPELLKQKREARENDIEGARLGGGVIAEEIDRREAEKKSKSQTSSKTVSSSQVDQLVSKYGKSREQVINDLKSKGFEVK